MSALTPEDLANVCKLLERLRTGELNLIPSLATADPRDPNGKSEAMLRRVEDLLCAQLRKMQEPVDNEPAFPICGAAADHQFTGLTLRDYFAAKAMAAEMITTFSDATPEAAEAFAEAATAAGRSCEAHLAHNAYLIADAMLKARSAS